MFRDSRVVISLTPDALEGAYVVGSRIVRTARQSLERAVWSSAWEDGLLEFDAPLARVLKDLNVRRGMRVSVLVHSPSDAVEVTSYRSTGPEAIHAAMLRVEDRVSVADARAVSDAMVVAHDQHEDTERTHVLACAADNASVQAVFGWVLRSGNRLDNHIPRATIPLISTLEVAADEAECVAYCYLDWSTATIASMFGGSLAFVRTFNAGYQSLAEAYARGVARLQAQECREGESPEREDEESAVDRAPALDMARGSQLLFENGVPSREARIGDSDNQYRMSVGPLLASVTQRLSVEIKQSVRYGVRDAKKRPRRLVLLGPGATIPGMASLLSETTELDVEVFDQLGPATSSAEPFASGSTEHAFATSGEPGISLIPIAAVERLAASGRTSAVRAGVILAVGLLLAEAGLISLERANIRTEADKLQGRLSEVRAESEARTRAADQIERLNIASYLSASVVGDQADWAAVFGDIGARTPERVRLKDIRAFSEGDTPMIALSGHAVDAPNEREGGTLGQYIETMKRSAFIERVELGTTRTETLDGVTARSFSIICQVRPIPFEAANPRVYVGPVPRALTDGGRP